MTDSTARSWGPLKSRERFKFFDTKMGPKIRTLDLFLLAGPKIHFGEDFMTDFMYFITDFIIRDFMYFFMKLG